MKGKLLIDKFLDLIEKSSCVLGLSGDDSGKFAEFSRIDFRTKGICVRSVSSIASSMAYYVFNDSGESIDEDKSISLSSIKLKSMLKNLPKDSFVELIFEDKKDKDDVDSIGTMIFKCGKTSWKMPCCVASLIQEVKVVGGEKCFSIDKDTFLNAFTSVAYAGNISDANFILCNVCVSVLGNNLYFGATDDIRCSTFKVGNTTCLGDRRFLLPIQFFPKILKPYDKGEVDVFCDKNFVRLNQANFSIKLSLPNGSDSDSFPKFESIVDKAYPFKVNIMASKLRTMISSCVDVNKEECLLKINDDNVNIYSCDNYGKMSYHSNIQSTGDKVNIIMAICSIYFYEFLKKVKEEVVALEFYADSGKIKSIKITDGANQCYIMKALIDISFNPESLSND